MEEARLLRSVASTDQDFRATAFVVPAKSFLDLLPAEVRVMKGRTRLGRQAVSLDPAEVNVVNVGG